MVLSRVCTALIAHLGCLAFESQGAFASQRCMPAARVIEAVDVLKDGGFGLAAGFPNRAPDQLRLDDLAERLDNGVDAPMFVKQESELILLCRVRCRLRARCSPISG